MSSTNTTSVRSWLFTTTTYPSTLHQGTSSVPSTPPTPTSILIAPRAVSLNPVDIQLMNLPLNNMPASIPYLNAFTGPKIAGRDFSGVVVAAGPQSGFNPDDEVMGINMGVPGTGFLSEVVSLDVAPGTGANVIPKPTHLDWVQAASLPCVYLTARTSIAKCEPFCTKTPASANRVVVLGGSSATGIYTVKLAKRMGWTVLSSCSGRNTDFVRSLGADELVDYTRSADAVVSAVKTFKPDAIVDCVGGTDTIGLAPQYVTIVGDKTGRDTMGGAALYLTHPRMVLRWFLGYLGVGRSYECINLDNSAGFLREVSRLQPEDVVVDSVFEFDRVKDAFERLDTGRCRGKVVVNMEGLHK